MGGLVGFVIALYSFVFMVYSRYLFPAKRNRMVWALLFSLLPVFMYILIQMLDIHWFSIPIIIPVMVIGQRISTGMNWQQAIYGGSLCVLSAYSFRGIFACLCSFFIPGIDVWSQTNEHYFITLLALLASLALFAIMRRTLLPDEKIKRFMQNGSQLKLVIIYEMVATINMTFLNLGRFLPIDIMWFCAVMFTASVLTFGMLIYAIFQSIQSTDLLEYQLKARILEDQYERQLRHYKSYQKYTKSFRAFKHDYQSMMVTLKSLIRMGDNEKALGLIDEVHDEMQSKVLVHKRYSNSVILDALLQDVANICEEEQIRYSFQVSAPKGTDLSTLDAIRVFSNMTENALEACRKVPAAERFIKVASKENKQWAMLEVVNAYDGKISVKNGKIVTRKKDVQSHGLGLRIIKEIVKNLGGFMIYEAHPEERVFLVRIHIPRVDPDKKP